MATLAEKDLAWKNAVATVREAEAAASVAMKAALQPGRIVDYRSGKYVHRIEILEVSDTRIRVRHLSDPIAGRVDWIKATKILDSL